MSSIDMMSMLNNMPSANNYNTQTIKNTNKNSDFESTLNSKQESNNVGFEPKKDIVPKKENDCEEKCEDKEKELSELIQILNLIPVNYENKVVEEDFKVYFEEFDNILIDGNIENPLNLFLSKYLNEKNNDNNDFKNMEFMTNANELTTFDLDKNMELINKIIEDVNNELPNDKSLDIESLINFKNEISEKYMTNKDKDDKLAEVFPIEDTLSSMKLKYLESKKSSDENNIIEISSDLIENSNSSFDFSQSSSEQSKNNLNYLKDTDVDILKEIANKNQENNNLPLLNQKLTSFETTLSETVSNSLETQVIRQDFLKEDLINTVEYMDNNNIQKLSVKLTPKELGEMSIEFIKDGNISKLVLTLSKDETLAMVEKGLVDIKEHIKDLTHDNISIEIKSSSEASNLFSDTMNQNLDKNNFFNNQKFKSLNSQNKDANKDKVVDEADNIATTDNNKNINLGNINLLA